jgi:hypothetical protein
MTPEILNKIAELDAARQKALDHYHFASHILKLSVLSLAGMLVTIIAILVLA